MSLQALRFEGPLEIYFKVHRALVFGIDVANEPRTLSLNNLEVHSKAVGRSKNPVGNVVGIIYPLIKIGLNDPSKSKAAPPTPGFRRPCT